MFEVPPGWYGEFFYIDQPGRHKISCMNGIEIMVGDIAALEIRFSDKSAGQSSTIRQIGTVGVDAAQIIVADELDLEECVTDPLFITEDSGNEITQKLITAHSLVTRKFTDGWTEILSDERDTLHRQLSRYIECENLGSPDELLFYRRWGDIFGVCERAEFGVYETPTISLGHSEMFNVSPNGSDGVYHVFGEFCDDRLHRCWILIHADFFVNGEPSSNILDVELASSPS